MGRTSIVTPPACCRSTWPRREETLLNRSRSSGAFDPSDFTTSRLWATADDGTRRAHLVVHTKGIALPAPTVVYGYGAYEIHRSAFSHHRLSLLDRGFAFAIAHVRGGGEMGRAWYENGRMEQKANTSPTSSPVRAI